MGENFKVVVWTVKKKHFTERERESKIKEWRELFSGSEELASQRLLNHTFFAIPKLVRLTFDVGREQAHWIIYPTQEMIDLFSVVDCNQTPPWKPNQTKRKEKEKEILSLNKSNRICPIPLSLNKPIAEQKKLQHSTISRYRSIEAPVDRAWTMLRSLLSAIC